MTLEELIGSRLVFGIPGTAITPEIVSNERFANAVALNSAGFNVARAVGPALGGIVVAAAGSGAAFLLNAASFVGLYRLITCGVFTVRMAAWPGARAVAHNNRG